MDDMIAVRQAVDRLLGGDLGPMLDLLAEDVRFEVAGGGDSPEYRRETGRQAVVDYFTSLGELVAFWQIDYGVVEGQVIAWGKERFTAEPCGLEGACEFALVFDLTGGMIGRFLVIEDLTSYFRRGGIIPTPSLGVINSTVVLQTKPATSVNDHLVFEGRQHIDHPGRTFRSLFESCP